MTTALRYLSLLLLPLCGCQGERVGKPSQSETSAQGSGFANGTVGKALDEYPLTMAKVRQLYEAGPEIDCLVEADSVVGLFSAMSLASELAPHVTAVEQNALLRESLRLHDITPREFILLSVTVTTAQAVLHLMDSLGEARRPPNVSSSVLTFIRTHRAALDSLDAMDSRYRISCQAPSGRRTTGSRLTYAAADERLRG